MILDTASPGTYSKVAAERADCLAECTGGRRREQDGKLSDNLHCGTSFAESFTLAGDESDEGSFLRNRSSIARIQRVISSVSLT